MHSFEVHSNQRACRKKVRLGLEQVYSGIHHDADIHDTTRICGKYNLNGKSHNGYILTQVSKEMYGPPKAVRIEYDAIV